MPGKKNTRKKASGSSAGIKECAAADFKEFLAALYPFIKITNEICVKNIAKSVMSLVLDNVKLLGRYAGLDEKIYNCHKEIMEGYKAVVNEYKESSSQIEILDGVCAILSSQIHQHEEYCGNQPLSALVKGEKERFVKDLYYAITSEFKEISFNDSLPKYEAESLCFKALEEDEIYFKCYSFIYDKIINKYGQHIFKLYAENFIERAAGMLYNKSVTDYFYEALKQEKDNLEGIVNVSVSALKESAGDESGATTLITERILQLYTKACKETEDIEIRLKDRRVVKPDALSFDDFIAFIGENTLKAAIKKEADAGTKEAVLNWRRKLEKFIRSFEVLSAAVLDEAAQEGERRYMLFIYEMRKSASDKAILSNEMITCFNEIKEYYEEMLPLIDNCPDKNIISGIHESVCLKVDILKESQETFQISVEEKLSGFTVFQMHEDDKRNLFNDWLDVWFNIMIQLDIYSVNYNEDALQKTDKFLQEAAQNAPAFDIYNKISKKIEKEKDVIKKLEVDYLKDYLLYEVRTFEEILMYSVSKLKESEYDVSVKYADACENLQSSVVELLKRHDIHMIAPSQSSFFDSKEHEVLVAEKNESYQKGQIIKLMNSGYKYNNTVLVRANVIAAK